jgi:hypothetical protein
VAQNWIWVQKVAEVEILKERLPETAERAMADATALRKKAENYE